MAEPLRHRQTKEAATDMFSLQPPRHIPTLPLSTDSVGFICHLMFLCPKSNRCARRATRPSSSRCPLVARAWASDALTLRSGPLDPVRERLHELLQEFAGAIADQLAMFIEELVGIADIGFRLLHGRHVQKHERLPQMMIGAEGTDRARRAADDRTRLVV